MVRLGKSPAMCSSGAMNRESKEAHSRELEMTAVDLDCYLDLFNKLGITVWFGGGWGVDALLGEQTRRHADLDIFLDREDSAKLRKALEVLGFEDVETDDQSAWNFVIGNGRGHQIDFHVVEFDVKGQGVYGPPANDETFSASSFTGRGVINGRQVHCLDAEFQIQSHTGYKIDGNDIHDVMALHERFGLPLPAEYDSYKSERK